MPLSQPDLRSAPVQDVRPRLCPLYRVLIHNDPVTQAVFVVDVLQEIFAKATQDAVDIMIEAHETGVALVEIVPLEHAEFHVDQAHSRARAAKFPLTLTCEPEPV